MFYTHFKFDNVQKNSLFRKSCIIIYLSTCIKKMLSHNLKIFFLILLVKYLSNIIILKTNIY